MSERDEFIRLIDKINDGGWLISDLWQTSRDVWNCVLREEGALSTAYGHSKRHPYDAIENAMKNRKPATNWAKVKREQQHASTNGKKKRVRI